MTPNPKVSGSLALLATGLRAVAGARSTRFSELAKTAGLDPWKDFQHVQLAGADLRGDDLTAFNFRHASFAGAKVFGAHFNQTVTSAQLAVADANIRSVAIAVGENLETSVPSLQAVLGPDVQFSGRLRHLIAKASEERDRPYSDAVYLSDKTAQIQRHIGRGFRAELARLRPATRLLLTFFQPTAEMDFDTLQLVARRARQERVPMFTFAFPGAFTEKAPNLAEKRFSELSRESDCIRCEPKGRDWEDRWEHEPPKRHRAGWGSREDGAQLTDVTTFLRVSLSARYLVEDLPRGQSNKGPVAIERIALKPGADFSAAAKAALERWRRREQPRQWSLAGHRFHVFTQRQDLDVAKIALALGGGPRNEAVNVSIGAGFDLIGPDEFYLVSGPPSSPIWKLYER